MVTDRTPDFQILGAPTQGICLRCFIDLGMQIAQALQQAYEDQQKIQDSLEASEAPGAPETLQELLSSVGTGPGLLEAVEAAEGVSSEPLRSASTKRRKKTDSETVNWDPESEAEAAHVDG